MSDNPIPAPPPITYSKNVDPTEPKWIKDELDKIEHLNTLRGQEYEAEANRLGFVVADKGLFADPDHPARTFRNIEDATELLQAQARRAGYELDLNVDLERGGSDGADHA